MTALWTAPEAAAATGGTANDNWAATGVSIDSRTVAPGDLFVALSGPNFDGHDYVRTALDSGAVAAMVTRGEGGLIVPDTEAGLRALATAARQRSPAKVIAVTGSVGKTGTKEALAHALGEQAQTHASQGNLNNHYGAPLSLARMPREAKYAIFELGMNHAGEIAPLSKMVRPHVAVITAVEAVHIGNLGSIEAIADAKAEIVAGLEPGGTLVLPRDNAQFPRLVQQANNAKLRTFGAHEAADARLLAAECDGAGTRVSAQLDGRPLHFTLALAGRHHAMNALAVLLAVQAVGGDPERAARSLSAVGPSKGRGRHHIAHLASGAVTIVDDSYNASPASVEAALSVLATMPGRRILVLGDMLELGDTARQMHAALRDAVEAAGVAHVFTAGPLAQALAEATNGTSAPDSAALAPLVRGYVRGGDVVLVKGSAGSRMGRVVDALMSEAG